MVRQKITMGTCSQSHKQHREGFIGKKHRLALAQAEELLRPDLQTDNIHDSLNCGKVSRLIRFLKNGAVYTLVYYTWVQCMVN